jgi:hypothetical protein
MVPFSHLRVCFIRLSTGLMPSKAEKNTQESKYKRYTKAESDTKSKSKFQVTMGRCSRC